MSKARKTIHSCERLGKFGVWTLSVKKKMGGNIQPIFKASNITNFLFPLKYTR